MPCCQNSILAFQVANKNAHLWPKDRIRTCTYSYVFLPGMVLTVLCPCLLNFPRCWFACLFVCLSVCVLWGGKKQLANNAWACLKKALIRTLLFLRTFVRTCTCMCMYASAGTTDTQRVARFLELRNYVLQLFIHPVPNSHNPYKYVRTYNIMSFSYVHIQMHVRTCTYTVIDRE